MLVSQFLFAFNLIQMLYILTKVTWIERENL